MKSTFNVTFYSLKLAGQFEGMSLAQETIKGLYQPGKDRAEAQGTKESEQKARSSNEPNYHFKQKVWHQIKLAHHSQVSTFNLRPGGIS